MSDIQDEPSEAKSPNDLVAAWVQAFEAAGDAEKDYRKSARAAVDLYQGKNEHGGEVAFNIYHSNVETLVPALYNSTPEPDVRRRYNDPDPTGKAVATVIERSLSYSVDQYDFDGLMNAVVRDMVHVSRACARIRYMPEMQVIGNDEAGEPVEDVVYAEANCEYVPWETVRFGPTRTWDDLPWLGFELFLTEDDVEKLNPNLASEIPYLYTAGGKSGDKKDGKNSASGPSKRAKVYEIWEKDSKRVYFVCPDYMDEPLRVEDDPLQLQNFWPMPRPMTALRTTDSLTPVTLHSVYKHLLTELDTVSKRILKLVRQLRNRGGYVGQTLDMKALSEADDGELIPLTSAETMLATSGDLNKLIVWFPMEPTIQALNELSQQRESIKQQIYEVTGISDIVRGASAASETATAQQIKSQWGSIRIQAMQAEVARFARDLFRLKAEIMVEKFPVPVLQMMTGIQITPEMEAMMRDDAARSFAIDIESDSTIRGDLARNQEQMAQFLAGTGQYAQAMGALVQGGGMPLDVAIEIYASFARTFKLGKQAEDALDRWAEQAKAQGQQQPQSAPGQPQQPDPAAMAAQQEQMKAQAGMAQIKAKAEADIGVYQQKAMIDGKAYEHKASVDVMAERARQQMGLVPMPFAG